MAVSNAALIAIFFGLLVLIPEIAARGAGPCADNGPETGIARDRAHNCTGARADSCAAQCALFSFAHP